jgi:hypothetical protein
MGNTQIDILLHKAMGELCSLSLATHRVSMY